MTTAATWKTGLNKPTQIFSCFSEMPLPPGRIIIVGRGLKPSIEAANEQVSAYLAAGADDRQHPIDRSHP